MEKILNITFSDCYKADRNINVISIPDFKEKAVKLFFQPHRIDFYGIIIITKGSATHDIAGNLIKLDEGDVVVFRPGLINSFQNYDYVDGWIMTFTMDYFLSTLQNEFMNNKYDLFTNFYKDYHFKSDSTDLEMYNTLMNLIHLEVKKRKCEDGEILILHLISTFFHSLYRANYQSVSEEDNQIDKHKQLALQFKLMVKENIYEHSDLKYYLQEMGIAQSTLQIATKHAFNKTPKRIVDEAILFEAQHLLTDPSVKIHEVAEKLGFSESTNFSKFFKKNMKITPENFRQNTIFNLV